MWYDISNWTQRNQAEGRELPKISSYITLWGYIQKKKYTCTTL